jgi:SagB-type dehydrogenase family enzyme
MVRIHGLLLIATLMLPTPPPSDGQETANRDGLIPLPEIVRDGTVSVERAITERRSVRTFTAESVTLAELAQVLWAAQGVTEVRGEPPAQWGDRPWVGGLLATPSAGALYPLELHVVVRSVDGLGPGTYRYVPERHALAPVSRHDLTEPLASAALGQSAILGAPLNLVVAAVVERTAAKYGARAERYVQMEVGACAENIYLQAGALGLGTVLVGAFRDDAVQEALGLRHQVDVFAILPVGRPSGG